MVVSFFPLSTGNLEPSEGFGFRAPGLHAPLHQAPAAPKQHAVSRQGERKQMKKKAKQAGTMLGGCPSTFRVWGAGFRVSRLLEIVVHGVYVGVHDLRKLT